ncbi:MAG: glucuronate isomerase, partial [Spirochaetota bacterium]
MKGFITRDFLLHNDTARELYHGYCSSEPIFDYHSHLSAEKIAQDYRFSDIARLWLAEDHYKWRAMRSHGIAEEFITGSAPMRDKFQKWAETVPYTAFNPLYHWTHLELSRVFGIDDLLNPDSADDIYARANARLSQDNFSVRGIIRSMKVRALCTTDDPCDDLASHAVIASEMDDLAVLPTFRADQAISIENSPAFCAYCERLGRASDIDIKTFDDYCGALRVRHDFFQEAGCRSFDCSFAGLSAGEYSHLSSEEIFKNAREGKAVSEQEADFFRSEVLYRLGVMNAEKGWVQQYHIGPLRNASSRLYASFGADAGADAMNDEPVAKGLASMLDRLDRESKLPRTILYNLNPSTNGVLASMCGSFQDGSFPGKIQFGPGWWFLDQKKGMEEQIEFLSAMGLLSHFVGMLTDSRSFLSFTRHEYFRRILCGWVGAQ